MRTFGLLVLFLLPVNGLPARAQVINGETPFDDTMLHRQASSTCGRAAAARMRQDTPARAQPVTAEPPASGADRRD